MSDFIIVFLITAIVGLISLTIFVICQQQVPATQQHQLDREWEKVNAVLRKLSCDWNRNRYKAVLKGLLTFAFYYILLKKKNPVGALDAIIVATLTGVLCAMCGNGFWNFLTELVSR